MTDPEGIETVMEGQNVIIVKGIDKEKVGQFAAEIRDGNIPGSASTLCLIWMLCNQHRLLPVFSRIRQ